MRRTTCSELKRPTYKERNRDRVRLAGRIYSAKKRAAHRALKLLSEEKVLLSIGGKTTVIPLNNRQFSFIDFADTAMLGSGNWSAVKGGRHRNRYACGRVKGADGKPRRVLLHRLITGAAASDVVDHKNGDGLDNRRSNLRICTQSLNNANQHAVRGATKLKGVDRLSGPHPFRAKIKKDGKVHYLGRFSNAADAARAYDAKAVLLFGEFARTNLALGLIS